MFDMLDLMTTVVAVLISVFLFFVYQKSSYSASSVNMSTDDGLNNPAKPKDAANIYEFSAYDIDGAKVSLEKYRGLVAYIVNVASAWGLTKKNYDEMAQLHDRYFDKGLRILAFPCNQFGSQEPGTPQEIKEFAKNHGFKDDLFGKIKVNGGEAHPLWKYLKEKQTGTLTNAIKWNFSKFLINRKGIPVKRFAPNVAPLDIVPDIEKLLAEES